MKTKPKMAISHDAQKPRARAKLASSTQLDQSSLPQLVGYNLRRAEVFMRQNSMRVFVDWDVHPAAYSTLMLISSNQHVTQTDVAQALNIKRPNMVALINQLERRNLITRSVYEEDRRNHLLKLTEQGEELLAEIEQPLKEMDKKITACWSAKERAQLITLLQRFYLQT